MTVNGGQNGTGITDGFTLTQNANGSIDVTLDSQTVYFDPGVIAKIVINTESSLTFDFTGRKVEWYHIRRRECECPRVPWMIFAAPDSKDISAQLQNMSFR